MGVEGPLTSSERSARRRARLRAQGLRPRTFWLPDTTTDEFKEQARKTCEWLWANQDEEAMAWIDAMNAEVLKDLPPPPWEDED